MNLKIKPKLKIHKPPSEGRLNKDQIIKNFFDRKLEPKTHLELINDIVGKTQKISVADYRNVIKNGGEFNITIDNYKIRNDINGATFDQSMNLASEILGIARSTLESVLLSEESVILNGYTFVADNAETSSNTINLSWQNKVKVQNEKIENRINFTISTNDKYVGKINWHNAGHFAMFDDVNAQKPHLNYSKKFENKKTINGHIYYTNTSKN